MTKIPLSIIAYNASRQWSDFDKEILKQAVLDKIPHKLLPPMLSKPRTVGAIGVCIRKMRRLGELEPTCYPKGIVRPKGPQYVHLRAKDAGVDKRWDFSGDNVEVGKL